MANIQLTENLRILRERSNLKQDEFSRYLNISRQTYSNYERGTRTLIWNYSNQLLTFIILPLMNFYSVTATRFLCIPCSPIEFPRAKFRILNAKNPIISSISPMKS